MIIKKPNQVRKYKSRQASVVVIVKLSVTVRKPEMLKL